MKKILDARYLILDTIFRAYQGLKTLFDPATEGDPYVADELGFEIKARKNAERIGGFGRRKFAWKHY